MEHHKIKDADELAGMIDGEKRKTPNGWQVCCPVHPEKTPSLSITNSPSGNVLAKCFGCGAQLPEVLQALGIIRGKSRLPVMTQHRQQEAPKETKTTETKKIVAVYDYLSQHGEILYQVVRYHPKTFRQRKPVGDGFEWNLKTVAHFVPYRLPEMLASKKPVFICEGEKDADALAAIGVTTTTFCGGAGKFKPDYLEYFQNRDVVLLPDNDAPGIDGMDIIARALSVCAKSIKRILLPDLPPKGDVSDWIAAGGTREALAALYTSATEYIPTPEAIQGEIQPKAEQPIATAESFALAGFIEFPDTTSKGKPLSTICNTQKLLDAYGITCRYNVIKKSIEILIPGQEFTADNYENCCLAYIESIAAKASLPTARITDYLTYIAERNQFNPVYEWIISKPWDGQSRVEDLAKSLGAQNHDLALVLLFRWSVGAVHAIMNPQGIDNSSVLVLQGDQGIGKTSWFWSLLGDRHDFGREGAIINPHDKDTVLSAIKYWIVELGEIDATFKKAEVAALKSFITRDFDEIRRPYAREESRYPRRTVFCASVNPRQFLHDDTGNRRYWTISCGDAMNPHHGIDMQQYWAEILHRYNAGERYTLTSDEAKLLNKSNEDFSSIDPIEDLILKFFDIESGNFTERFTATDVLLIIGYDKPNKKQTCDCSTILRRLTGMDSFKSNGKRVFRMPKPAIISKI